MPHSRKSHGAAQIMSGFKSHGKMKKRNLKRLFQNYHATSNLLRMCFLFCFFFFFFFFYLYVQLLFTFFLSFFSLGVGGGGGGGEERNCELHAKKRTG